MPRCAAMAVGSVPHTDPRRAVDLILDHTPEIPAWPQMPRRAYLENMYVQFSEGLPGVVVDSTAERIYVRNEISADELMEFMDRLENGGPDAFSVSESYAAGIPVLEERLTGLSPQFVKGQVTGPVSFGLSVPREDKRALLYDDTLRDVLISQLAMKARWQESVFARLVPGAVPVVMVDEPYLTQIGSAFVSIPADIAFPAIERCLEGIQGMAGLHVCGGTDWNRMAKLPVDILNFDAADYLDSILTQRDGISAFVAEGGILAWGIIPNDERALEWDGEKAGTQVLEAAEALASAGGTHTEEILAASFVSPACGTGSLALEVAEGCFRLTADTSAWLRTRFGWLS